MAVDNRILSIIKEAIKLEAQAYLYYYNSAKEAELPDTKSLFIQLAEEEKKHERILFNEYKFMKKALLKEEGERFGPKKVSYLLPDNLADLLWKSLPNIAGMDIAGIILPTQFFGGDFFDCYPLKGIYQSRAAFAVIFYDVMGHGLDVSITKSLIRASFEGLTDNFILDELPEPARILTGINKQFFKLSETRDSLASISFGKYNPVTSTYRYSIAGTELPVLIRAADCSHEFLLATDYSIGIEEKKEYNDRIVDVRTGDLLFFYTDGLTEAERSPGFFYGRERAIECIKRSCAKSSKEILSDLLRDLKEFMKDSMLSDEMSLLLMKF